MLTQLLLSLSQTHAYGVVSVLLWVHKGITLSLQTLTVNPTPNHPKQTLIPHPNLHNKTSNKVLNCVCNLPFIHFY